MTEEEALQTLIRRFPNFESWEFSKQLPVLSWFTHRFWNKEQFVEEDIQRCFQHLDFKPIPLFNVLKLEISRCSPIVRSRLEYRDALGYREINGYKLRWRTRDKLDKEFKQVWNLPTTIEIHRLLEDLPAKIPIAEEKTYLEETLKCYSCGANRAAIVMCWNLTFYHLCNVVYKDPSRLAKFDQALPKRYPKASITAIATFDDFSRLRESEVLEVCNSGNIVSKSHHKILKAKLDIRNTAAHPSNVVISQLTVEEFIKDLIENVVLQLK
jgi:hypothetical protein